VEPLTLINEAAIFPAARKPICLYIMTKSKYVYPLSLLCLDQRWGVMDLLEAIRSRRSVRAFKRKKVLNEYVERLIDAARWAPSAGNIQPWEFVIIRKLETKKALAEAALGQTFIEEASVVIVVCADEVSSFQRYGIRGKALYCIQDTAAATQNIHLAAYSLGLGTCWVGAFEEDEARRILRIPVGVRPVSIIPIGYPAENPRIRMRRPVNQIVHSELF
jgi:nitroreductase